MDIKISFCRSWLYNHHISHNSQGHLIIVVIAHGHKNIPLKLEVMVIEIDISFNAYW